MGLHRLKSKGQVMDLAFDAVVPVKGLEPSWGHPG